MFTKKILLIILLTLLPIAWSSLPSQAQVPISIADLGDAPDSSNTVGGNMTAYAGVFANFPTVLDPTTAPYGPKHLNAPLRFHLGKQISVEQAADGGLDADGVNNLQPAADAANQDGADDGLTLPTDLPHCQRIRLTYTLNVINLDSPEAVVNVWADWQRDGTWLQSAPPICNNGAPAPDWALENELIILNATGLQTFETPPFVVWNPDPTQPVWLRITVSDSNANIDGSGPQDGFRLGETEDYLVPGKVVELTPTNTATEPPTPPPSITPTPTDLPIGTLPTPTSTPTQGTIGTLPTPTSTPTQGTIGTLPTNTPTATPTQGVIANPPTPTSTPTQGTIGTLPTNTPTVTPTQGTIGTLPTNTPTPTQLPLGILDVLEVTGMEVTQGIQDLVNSVALVENKRTYVRVHARSLNSNTYATGAFLVASKPGAVQLLFPINNSAGAQVNVRPFPYRGALQDSFLFELPSIFRSGTVDIAAYVNNAGANPVEANTANNVIERTVSFTPVKPMNLITYLVSYEIGDNFYWPAPDHYAGLLSWLRRAYPISQLNVQQRFLDWGPAVQSGSQLANPTCSQINVFLAFMRDLDAANPFIPSDTRYYGLVDDGGGFMRGCKNKSRVASGPIGAPPPFAWDTDGSYGDWYGGHELGHAYGRPHAPFCGAPGSSPYPYINGRISPTWLGPFAMYGFDIETHDIYHPLWADVMTYCDYQWVGGYTYENLLTNFQTEPAPLFAAAPIAARLLIVGVINPQESSATFEQMLLLPESQMASPRAEDGTHLIILRNAEGVELARYPFTPEHEDEGPTVQEADPLRAETEQLVVSQLVPYVEGTTHVEVVEAASNTSLHSVRAGLNPPTVQIVKPNDTTQVTGDTLSVQWSGADPDGDALHYRLQFSTDGGQTWQTLPVRPGDTQVDLDVRNLPATQNGKLRIWATDGIHAAFADTPFLILVPNRAPEVQIVSPSADATFGLSQTVTFVGNAFDLDVGQLLGEQLTWESNLDGLLGTGETLSLATLSQGTHAISLTADDGAGGVASAATTVNIAADVAALAVADELVVGPHVLLLDTSAPNADRTLSVDNLNLAAALDWNAVSSAPWIKLSQESGLTPASVTVSIDRNGLALGVHDGVVTFSSPAIPGQTIMVPVQAQIEPVQVLLPIIKK